MGNAFEKEHTASHRQPFPKLSLPGKRPLSSIDQQYPTGKHWLSHDRDWKDQMEVQQPNSYPECAMGKVQAQFSNGERTWGSGCLIRNNLVLTCAHLCFNQNLKSKAVSIRYHPAPLPTPDLSKAVKVVKYFYVPQFETSIPKQALDFALLQLELDLEEKNGYFGVDFSEGVAEGNRTIAGYPRDGGGRLHLFQGLVIADGLQLRHSMKTEGGVGGGPVLEERNGEWFVVGLHSYGHKERNQKAGVRLRVQLRKLFNTNMPIEEWELKIAGKLKKDKDFQQFFKQNWKKITKAQLGSNFFDSKRTNQLAKLDWPNIQYLSLSQCQYKSQTLSQLVKSSWNKLKSLDMSKNPFGAEGIKVLVKGNWPKLQQLNVSECGLNNEGAAFLLAQIIPSLKSLNLSTNNFNQIGLLSSSQSKLKLEQLHLDGNMIGPMGAQSLANSSFASNLQRLSVRNTKLSNSGVECLMKSKWNSLQKLDIGMNLLEGEAIKHLRKGHCPRLSQLIVDCNRVGSIGVQELLHADWSLQLINIKLNNVLPQKANEYLGLLSNHFERCKVFI